MPLKRQCPSCGAELAYANLPGYQRATRTKALCRKCAASPKIVKQKLTEAEEKASKKGDGNFMAAFFDHLEARISGSNHP